MKSIILLLQIRCAELTTDGLILCQFILGRSKLCYQRFDFCFQIGYGFLSFSQELFQIFLLLFLHHIFLCCCHQCLIILTLYSHLGCQWQGLSLDLLHGLNGNLLLLDTFKGLFQFCNFFLTFLLLEFPNTEMFFVFVLLLSFDTMLQHNRCEHFSLFLNPEIELCQRMSLTGDTLTGDTLIGKCLFQ